MFFETEIKTINEFDEKKDKIYFITVATKPHHVLDVLIKNTQIKGETIQVLGLTDNYYSIGQDNNDGSRKLGLKLQELYKFINQDFLNDNDIIIFVDAYDVYYSGNKNIILEKFKEMKRPIVFGAEKCCYPDSTKSIIYPKTNCCFPYLNSGLFIGKVYAFRECMNNCENEFIDDINDQLWWTNKFLDRQDLIELDYNNQLFLNCLWLNPNDLKINEDSVTFLPNNSTPQFIHGNGPSKELIVPLLEYFKNKHMNNITIKDWWNY
jgi:hypothetical protein